MKTLTKKAAIAAFAIALVPALMFGDNGKGKKPVSKACLEVSGTVIIGKKSKDKNIQVELIENNKVVNSAFVCGNETFYFRLNRDRHYTFRITQPGYFPKLVSVSTRLPETSQSGILSKFHFDLIQEENKQLKKEQQDLRDFPVAIIYYDIDKGYFDYNQKYTNYIKKATGSTSIK